MFRGMKTVNRREFLGGALVTGGAVLLPDLLAQEPVQRPPALVSSTFAADVAAERTPVDFRYSPVLRQTAFCFPDDPCKSLIDESGELLYGYNMEKGVFFFPLRFAFALYGMQESKIVEQSLESPSIPIVRTVLSRADAIVTLTTFATRHPGEGRVDNVLMEIRPNQRPCVNVSPLIRIRTVEKCELKTDSGNLIVSRQDTGEVMLVGKIFQNPSEGTVRGTIFDVDTDTSQQLTLHRGVATPAAPYRAFFRFPQEGQSQQKVIEGLDAPEQHLAAARHFWSSWSAFHDPVSWTVPGKEGDFLAACARNILQAREVKNGKRRFKWDRPAIAASGSWTGISFWKPRATSATTRKLSKVCKRPGASNCPPDKS